MQQRVMEILPSGHQDSRNAAAGAYEELQDAEPQFEDVLPTVNSDPPVGAYPTLWALPLSDR